jgi:hypothetical protein
LPWKIDAGSQSGRAADSQGSHGMSLDRDWDSIRPERSFRAADAGMGILRITLLFGSAAVALALLVAPLLEDQTRQAFARDGFGRLDTMSTGSIGRSGIYTIRKSVLQSGPDSVCLIRQDGRRSGDC